MPNRTTTLSPRAAVAFGLFIMALGAFVVLLALGVVTGEPPSKEAPRWVGALAGLVFVLLGAALIVGYALAGGAMPDGDLPPGTPPWIRVTQMTLGLGIVGALGAIVAWIAFGPGPRPVSVTGSVGSGPASESTGRAIFGTGFVLLAAFFVALLVVSVRRLRRPQ
jgi:hypothetical protein